MIYQNLYHLTDFHLADLRAQEMTEWQKELETILDQLFNHLYPIIERGKPKYDPPSFTDSLLRLLTEFLRVSKVKKKDFAKAYGCRAEHISRFYSKDRKLNFITLIGVIHDFGYSVKLDSMQGWVAVRVKDATI